LAEQNGSPHWKRLTAMLKRLVDLFLFVSLAGFGLAYLETGDLTSAYSLIAACAVVASILLSLWTGQKPKLPVILVDGSNVLHWANNQPDIAPVLAVVHALKAKGYAPGVMFDANARYKIGGRYLDDRDFAMQLGLPLDRVFVVPKGTQADAYLLEYARDEDAQIVTNDRFRDWADKFPMVTRPGVLIRGGIRDGAVWLDIDTPSGTRARAA
jgi:hypothetical protein